ncbi:MAG: class I SAM-dependent methyltransferase [Pseudomonadales bacterium]|nr:class I SAM-dependent methyltransferase [Pseudomonadales bacterium]
MSAWFDTPLGKAVQQAEVEIANHIMPTRFGYHLLYCGQGDPDKLLKESPILHKFVAADAPLKQSWLPFVYGEGGALPLANESIDLVVLQHSLDFEENPHQVLREAARILIPGGTLVVIGFNPKSFWWVWRLFHHQTKEAPWAARFISPSRLSEWLSLLELEVEGCETGYYLPPWQGLAKGDAFQRFKSGAKSFFTKRGAVYVMVSKKTVSCMTPIAPKWRIGRRRFLNNPKPLVNKEQI